jgi:serine/threonine protein kinase
MNANRQQLKELFHTAVELAPHDREAFLKANCAADDELHCEVSALLSAHESAGDFIQQPALVDVGLVSRAEDPDQSAFIGQRIGPYEIVREIGHGGMGTVFLAVRADDQYRKQVAIKLVNRGMDTDTILRRFMMERQILANLEHPSIAGLLDGGSTADVLPYFVMEYIEGQPIDEYCDAKRFTTAQRLELFRQVCAALQYAHQNLVVHRDIKPSNILVTAEGVPKLLDFGIAKLLSPGWAAETGDLTASMQVLMTPAYASPEQLRGLSITTASDVYSLGVVLYELLSGHHPYHLSSRQPEEVAQVILREEPLKPSIAITRTEEMRPTGRTETATITPESVSRARESTVDKLRRRLSGDLDNIVLKALRKEPQRRYASVQEFSEDIRRHLEGLPVTATPDTFSYRAGKFIQRNKASVLAAAAVVLTLLAATAITTWQARVARRERDKAEMRFNQVRKLANSVLFEYHDGIEKLPGSTPVRERMVKDALEYLDNLSRESGNDPSLQRELAAAYTKVGDVQGAPYRANLGDYAGALASHKKALAIREESSSHSTPKPELKLELVRSYGAVGELSQVTGDIPAALENYHKAFAVFDSLSSEVAETKRELSILNVRFGRALAACGELEKALQAYRKGIAITNELSAANPTEPGLKRAQAYAQVFLGDALEEPNSHVSTRVWETAFR